MEVQKMKRKNKLSEIVLLNGDKKLIISFDNNLDLKWTLTKTTKEKLILESFEITKENYAIYTLFEQLYNNVKNASIFDINTEIALFNSGLSTFNSLSEIYDYYIKDVEKRKNSPVYQELFDGNTITWYSDEIYSDSNDALKITFDGDKFILEFAKRKQNELLSSPYSIPIKFKNNESKYFPFNILFIQMSEELQNYNTKFHQIHIEEYLYEQKILKK